MFKSLLNILRLKNLNTNLINSEERLKLHKQIFSSKKLLKDTFIYYHNLFDKYDKKYLSCENGSRVELGAGIYPIKMTYSDVISSDVIENKDLDMVLDAENINLENNSVRVFFGQNMFHHISDPNKFFKSASEKLKIGGGIIILEPSDTFLSNILHKNMHLNEFYDMSQKNWQVENKGPMTNANQAMSSIIFYRDKEKFLKNYPNFEIKLIFNCNKYLHYLLSGGLNFITLFPNKLKFILDVIEFMLIPMKKVFSIHHIIILKKIK
tara:strand:- start:1793 stop:2590 length:798 start_codon:yes stop_codon:yes gene_type:complete